MAEGLKREPFHPITEDPKDVAHAPIIFFDAAPAGSVVNGIIGATLVAHRQLPSADGLKTDLVIAAHLRCSLIAAKELVNHLSSAIQVVEEQMKMVAMSGTMKN